jgi:hypothetical protein
MGGKSGGGGAGGLWARSATTVRFTRSISPEELHTDWKSIGEAEELPREAKRSHRVELGVFGLKAAGANSQAPLTVSRPRSPTSSL